MKIVIHVLTFSISLAILSASVFATTNYIQQFRLSNTTTLIIEKGDITKCKVDAIVNAANEQLLGGGGVCGAIFDAAGWQALQKACDVYPEHNSIRCPVGHARITGSFNLASRGIHHIIHAVGPDCRQIQDEKEQDSLLQQAYNNSLMLADLNSISTIAFPFISSAIYAFPKERAARIALKSIQDYVRHNKTTISRIHFVLFSWSDFDVVCETARIHIKG